MSTPSAPGDHLATWRRSVGLFRAFLSEQSDPDRFYGALAADSAAHVERFHDMRAARLLDVGGGPGFFADAFQGRGATYVAVDADAGEMRLHGRDPGPRTVQARGAALPFADGVFDVAYSSNVLEHVADPWAMADEMVRVVRPGGTVVISYTLWFGPWGGHETSPWHLLGGRRAAKRYERRQGHAPKNVFGESLFALTAAQGIAWARGRDDATIVSIEPRYLPRQLHWIVRVPGLREALTWNLMIVLRRRAS
ncbi:MAG: class I SAM-dependent methyltransferase [Candidatus Nanopelagicales bacterium]